MQAAAHVELLPSPDCHAAVQIVHQLRDAGYSAYLVGGCVRDLVLGHEPKDYDVATSAKPADVKRLFRRVIEVGIAFGVVRVRLQALPGEWSEVEVATFRADGGYSDGRRPDHVRFTDAREDVLRRDFTLNGLLLDPVMAGEGSIGRAESGLVVDLVGGLQDLRQGLLRAIGEPRLRFGEDALRLLRAARFAARFGLAVEPDTATAIAELAPTLQRVSVERITAEVARMLVAPTAETALRLLADLGLAAQLWPDLLAADPELRLARRRAQRCGQTADVAQVLPEGLQPGGGLDLPLVLASLSWPRADWLLSGEAQRTLRLSNSDRQAALIIGELATQGLRGPWLHQHPPPRPWPAGLARWLRHPLADQALQLLEAAEELPSAAAWRRARAAWPASQAFPPPALNGRDLQALGFAAGPRFKAALLAAEDAQLEGATPAAAVAVAVGIVSGVDPQPCDRQN